MTALPVEGSRRISASSVGKYALSGRKCGQHRLLKESLKTNNVVWFEFVRGDASHVSIVNAKGYVIFKRRVDTE
jgi:hypothetical protein